MSNEGNQKVVSPLVLSLPKFWFSFKVPGSCDFVSLEKQLKVARVFCKFSLFRSTFYIPALVVLPLRIKANRTFSTHSLIPDIPGNLNEALLEHLWGQFYLLISIACISAVYQNIRHRESLLIRNSCRNTINISP